MSEPTSYVSSSHTVAELKVMCKDNGLSVAGRKADLIARLNEHFSEDSISLEEAETVPLPAIEEEDEILVAEVIEAEVIEDVEEEKKPTAPKTTSAVTLMDQIKNPKIAAILLTILLATGGWYWYVSNQLQPFTADDLRYGDSMEFTVLNGEMEVTGAVSYTHLTLPTILRV